jgi:hypothetical protein
LFHAYSQDDARALVTGACEEIRVTGPSEHRLHPQPTEEKYNIKDSLIVYMYDRVVDPYHVDADPDDFYLMLMRIPDPIFHLIRIQILPFK